MIVKPGVPDELRWLYEARFGMFVHFGISSMLGRGEWVLYRERIRKHEYEELATCFNTPFGRDIIGEVMMQYQPAGIWFDGSHTVPDPRVVKTETAPVKHQPQDWRHP